MNRYGHTGPRYTSYPTAMHFREFIDTQAYSLAATGSKGALGREPLSLYIHVPFCFSPCFYCGCNKVVTRKLDNADTYVRHLLEEITLRGRLFGRERVVEQMHFGGGTPTFLPKKRLIEIIDRIDGAFQLSAEEDRDYSMEIDPRTVNAAGLQLINALGFNRISLGVQDFDEAVQRAVNRVQPVETVRATYEAARALGFRSINFDLIYGLPLQTPASFAATLTEVVKMRPDRLAVYGYAHLPEVFKAQRQFRSEDLPDTGSRLLLLQTAIEMLVAAGYVYIGMDHFALPHDSLARAKIDGSLHRSFQGYTTHANRDLVGLGVSAIGHVGNMYVQNHKSLADYQAALDRGQLPSQRGACMSPDDVIRNQVIHQIMCHGNVDIARIESQYGIQFREYFSDELRHLAGLQAEGLVDLTPQSIRLSAAGRLLMRVVAMAFDAYLKDAQRPAAMSRLL
jgi:oxygen-independent coproporphyrinogen-3 oxidase